MESLSDKLLKLKETLNKTMDNSGIGGHGSVKGGASLPSRPTIKRPGDTNSKGKAGIAPKSKKNPVKQAQQVHNNDIKDIKMKEAQSALKPKEVLKYEDNGQWSIEKSNYPGYTPEDNARRKANNLPEGTQIKTMDRIKQYGGSGPNAADKEAKEMRRKSKKNPVKEYSKEEIDAINREKGLKKEEEQVNYNSVGQWSVSKRCWDGYEPTPGKEAYEEGSCQPIKKKDDKDWSPKAKHKSDKGGLTEEGRKSYNKKTGGNLKAPQPEGGKRKKSFCARNKGQLEQHNIDCSKTPDKRACKARKRWKC